MLVKVLSFGSNWWARGQHAPAEAMAYYNSTGLHCGSKIRRHWVISGLLRFNAISNFNPARPQRAIGGVFLCSELAWALGGNRLLFSARVSDSLEPDCYLISVSSLEYGAANLASSVWRSGLSRVIAVSQLGDRQEIMLLMRPADWISTRAAFWQLQVRAGSSCAELVKVGVPLVEDVGR